MRLKKKNDIEYYTREVNEKIFKGINIIVLKDFDIMKIKIIFFKIHGRIR